MKKYLLVKSGEVEQIVYLNLSDLHAFKDHPFSVKERGENGRFEGCLYKW